jgi:hypothetical protein
MFVMMKTVVFVDNDRFRKSVPLDWPSDAWRQNVLQSKPSGLARQSNPAVAPSVSNDFRRQHARAQWSQKKIKEKSCDERTREQKREADLGLLSLSNE